MVQNIHFTGEKNKGYRGPLEAVESVREAGAHDPQFQVRTPRGPKSQLISTGAY